MTEQKLECVITDLDGSLLNKEKRVSPQDLAAIRALKAKGIPVFVCTGRHFAFAKQVVSQIGFDCPVCACNGGHIYDYSTGKTLFAAPIPPGVARRLHRYLEEKGISYMVYTTEHPLFDNPQNPRLPFWIEQLARFDPSNRFELRFLNEEGLDMEAEVINKFLLTFVDGAVADQLQREFNHDNSLSAVFSDVGLLDVNAAGVNKGRGARELSRLFGFSLEHTLALGDNFNDAELLGVCGMSAAPANASDSIKALARFVTTSNEDSPLTHAVRHFCPGLLDEAT